MDPLHACRYMDKLHLLACMSVIPDQRTAAALLQNRFRHYRDLWRLDTEGLEWEQMPSKGAPKARSGHRMATYKHKLIVFGGFHDDGGAGIE